MYQRDYFLRMVEMISELIARILGLIKKGDLQQAERLLDNAYYNFLKQEAAYFKTLDKEKLTTELMQQHNFTHHHLEILAELFLAEAELSFSKGNQSTSIEYYEKALLLFEFLMNESKAYSAEKLSKIALIKEKIGI